MKPPRIVIEAERCPACAGTGRAILPEYDHTPRHSVPAMDCPSCHGRGWVWESWARAALYPKALDALHAAQPKSVGVE